MLNDEWETVNSIFNSCRPVVVANIQTINNETGLDVPNPNKVIRSIPFLTTAINVTNNEIKIALERSETGEGNINSSETIAYMIASPNIQDSFVDDDNKTIFFETIREDNYFVGWDDSCKTVNFENTYTKIPLIAANKNSRNEKDGGWFRRCDLTNTTVGFQIDEDGSKSSKKNYGYDSNYQDTERKHAPETGGIFVFSDNFVKREISLDHYLIEHDGIGLTCQPEKVTIKACADNVTTCTTYASSTDVTLNYDSKSQNYTFTGSTLADVVKRAPGTVTLSLSNMNPVATNGYKCYNTVTGSNSCDIVFYDSGFIFDIQDNYSCKPQNNVTIKAVRKDDTTQRCIPSFQNTTVPVDFSFNYVSPNTNPSNTKPKINNTDLNATINLTFDNNGESQFEFIYPDAGQIGITASFDNGTVKAVGNDNTTFKPFGFYVYTTTANWEAENGANSSVFKKAGEEFNLSAKAVCWESDGDVDLSNNSLTPNYQESNVGISHTLVEPSGGNLGSISVSSLNFSNGQALVDNQTFSEVGIIKFTVTDDDYLGAGSITGTSANIGRFIPYNFVIENISNGKLANQNGAFKYIGQTTTYQDAPKFTIRAVNKDNQTTTNYIREVNKDNQTTTNFFKLDANEISLNYPAADNQTKGADGNYLPITFDKASLILIEGNGTGEVTFGNDNVTYDRNEDTLTNPFTPNFNIDIINANDGDLTTNFIDKRVNVTGDKLYFGRLNIQNAYGSELDNLTVNMLTEYYENGVWNLIEDNKTDINLTDFDLDNFAGNLDRGEASITNASGVSEGNGNVILSAPGEGNEGTVDIYLKDSSTGYSSWLKDIFDNESRATITFGIFRGYDRIIDWQEVPAK